MANKILKRIVAVVVAAAMVVPTFMTLNAEEKQSSEGYEIYPVPHEINYEDGTFVIRNDANVVFESGIDDYTKDKLISVLDNKGIKANESEATKKGATNILIGVKDSDEYVDEYADANVAMDEALFSDHINPYVLDIDDNVITIVGKDTDSAFYGVVSLMHILNQLDSRTIRNLTISDYADTKTRGFIEGYYGIPWSNEDRMSLMRFGGQFKMTSYIFAPKDDPYHSARWRELYPEEKLEGIAEMARVGNENKCRFVWTIHPFMNGGITAATYDTDIELIKAKFEQLYQSGVRQFGVLGDDAGSLPRNIVVRTMTDLQQWVEEKGDVYNLVFCPGGYNDAMQGNYSELNEYDADFPKDIQIFWTGQAVCQPVEQRTLDNFRRKNLPAGRDDRRSPLFWLNWPVNDINMNRILMGQGSLLHNDVNPDDLSGVVTNPMQDAEPSKVAIFAVADFAWNVGDFNDSQSWKDSFKYIDADAYESLYEVAKHMSDPSPNGHGLVLEESAELKPLLDSFVTALESGSVTKEECDALIREFEKIMKACDDFHVKSKNERMKEQLLPFTNALKDQAEAAILLIQTKLAIDENNASAIWGNYSQATAKITAAKSHDRITISGTTKALPGSKRIIPFLTNVNDILAPIVNSTIDDSKIITRLITNRQDTPDGALEKLTDNNESTQVIWKSPNSTTAGTYIGLLYSQPIDLKDITFKMGQSGNPRDTFNAAKIQYTEDGETWIDLAGSEYTDMRTEVKVENLDLRIRGIRLISTEDKTNMWLGCKDIVVNAAEQEQPGEDTTISGTGFYNTENMSIRQSYGGIENMTDGNRGTYVYFAEAPYKEDDALADSTLEGAYIGLEFDKLSEVSSVEIIQGSGDHIDKGRLEYSVDGTTWNEIGTYENIGEVFTASFDTVMARKIRFVNTEWKKVWWQVFEFTASKAGERPITPTVFKHSRLSVYGSYSDGNMLDGNEDTFAWYSPDAVEGDYVGLDLGSVVPLGKIHFSMGSDFWASYSLQYSTDGEVYEKAADFEGQTADIDLSDTGISARYVRMVNRQTKKTWLQVKEFNVQKPESNVRNDALITNSDAVKAKNPTVIMKYNWVSIEDAGNITLKPGEYLGVQLDRIKDITNIEVDTADGLEVQTSLNNIVWTAVAPEAYEDARYIRLMNTSSSDVTVDLQKFVVESYEVARISVTETTFGNKSTHLDAFDHDRTTEAVLQGSQNEGQFITYDLGQIIPLESLKLVLHDGTTDFPRHAKVSVSENGTDWKDVMQIGNQDGDNEGEAENSDNIADLFPDHEISYYTKSVDGIGMDIRFIKFEITRTKAGADKWVRIREIELNGGNMYLPEVNDPTIVTSAEESTGNTLLNMIDGDVSTTFRPVGSKAGAFTYRISDQTDVKKITILQSPSLYSNAAVTAEVVKDGNVETVTLGSLMTSLNEFNTSAFDNVLSITVTWEENSVPEIHEIILARGNVSAADKTELQSYYDANKAWNTDSWTLASAKVYQEALIFADNVLKNEYVTQAMVDTALSELKGAVDGKVERPDLAAFEAQVNEIIKGVLAEENYLPRTWRIYAERLAEAEAVKNNGNISQAEIDVILEKLEAAVEGLIYEMSSIEELEVLSASVGEYKEDDYAKASYVALQEAVAAAEAMVEADKADRQNPVEVKVVLNRLQDAIAGLVSLTELRTAIKAAEEIPTEGYVDVSVKALRDAIAQAKAVEANENATKKDVADAIQAMETAAEGLIPEEALAGVKAELERLKAVAGDNYTEDSYQALQDEIARVEDAIKTGTDYAEYLAALKEKEEALVDVTELKAVIKEAEAIHMDIYTEECRTAVETLLAEARALCKNGTAEAVSQVTGDLAKAIKNLYVNAEYANAEIKVYVDALNGNFTVQSRADVQKVIDEVLKTAEAGTLTEEMLKTYKVQLEELKDMLIDTTELLEAIAEAEKVDGIGYTSKSYNAYVSMIADAKKLLENGKATEIADAVDALKNVEKVLVKIGDFSELQKLVEKCKAMNLAGYTQKSADALRSQIVLAELMIADADADQAEIDAQIEAIKKAEANLEKENTKDQGKDQGSNKAPATADAVNVFVWMLLFAGVVLAGLYGFKKRERSK